MTNDVLNPPFLNTHLYVDKVQISSPSGEKEEVPLCLLNQIGIKKLSDEVNDGDVEDHGVYLEDSTRAPLYEKSRQGLENKKKTPTTASPLDEGTDMGDYPTPQELQNQTHQLISQPYWIKPDLETEKRDLLKTSKKLGIDFQLLMSSYQRGRLVDLDDNVWQDLHNTESYAIHSMMEARDLTSRSGFGDSVDGIVYGFVTNADMPAPIVLKLSDRHYYLMAGEKRLTVARGRRVTPKVWMVDLSHVIHKKGGIKSLEWLGKKNDSSERPAAPKIASKSPQPTILPHPPSTTKTQNLAKQPIQAPAATPSPVQTTTVQPPPAANNPPAKQVSEPTILPEGRTSETIQQTLPNFEKAPEEQPNQDAEDIKNELREAYDEYDKLEEKKNKGEASKEELAKLEELQKKKQGLLGEVYGIAGKEAQEGRMNKQELGQGEQEVGREDLYKTSQEARKNEGEGKPFQLPKESVEQRSKYADEAVDRLNQDTQEVEKEKEEIDAQNVSGRKFTKEEIPEERGWGGNFVDWVSKAVTEGVNLFAKGTISIVNRFVTGLLNPLVGTTEYIAELLDRAHIPDDQTELSKKLKERLDASNPDGLANGPTSVLISALFGEKILDLANKTQSKKKKEEDRRAKEYVEMKNKEKRDKELDDIYKAAPEEDREDLKNAFNEAFNDARKQGASESRAHADALLELRRKVGKVGGVGKNTQENEILQPRTEKSTKIAGEGENKADRINPNEVFGEVYPDENEEQINSRVEEFKTKIKNDFPELTEKQIEGLSHASANKFKKYFESEFSRGKNREQATSKATVKLNNLLSNIEIGRIKLDDNGSIVEESPYNQLEKINKDMQKLRQDYTGGRIKHDDYVKQIRDLDNQREEVEKDLDDVLPEAKKQGLENQRQEGQTKNKLTEDNLTRIIDKYYPNNKKAKDEILGEYNQEFNNALDRLHYDTKNPDVTEEQRQKIKEKARLVAISRMIRRIREDVTQEGIPTNRKFTDDELLKYEPHNKEDALELHRDLQDKRATLEKEKRRLIRKRDNLHKVNMTSEERKVADKVLNTRIQKRTAIEDKLAKREEGLKEEFGISRDDLIKDHFDNQIVENEELLPHKMSPLEEKRLEVLKKSVKSIKDELGLSPSESNELRIKMNDIYNNSIKNGNSHAVAQEQVKDFFNSYHNQMMNKIIDSNKRENNTPERGIEWGKRHEQLYNNSLKSLNSNKELDSEQKKLRSRYTRKIIGNITDGGMKRLEKYGFNVNFHKGDREIAQAYINDMPTNSPKRVLNKLLEKMKLFMYGKTDTLGYFNPSTRTVNDADGKFGAQTLAHEMGHALDGPKHEISNTKQWQKAFNEEILKAKNLSNYSTTNSSEGFAEFSRLVLGEGIPLGLIQKRFPLCTEVWKQWGLWPGSKKQEYNQNPNDIARTLRGKSLRLKYKTKDMEEDKPTDQEVRESAGEKWRAIQEHRANKKPGFLTRLKNRIKPKAPTLNKKNERNQKLESVKIVRQKLGYGHFDKPQ